MSKANFLFTLIGALSILIGCQGTAVLDDDSTGDDDDTGGNDVNYALSFDGDGFALADESLGSVLSTEFTVELWFQRTGVADGYIIDARDPGDDWDSGWTMYEVSDAAEALGFWYSDNVVHGPSIGSLGSGWHHVAVVRTVDGRLAMYVDGALEGEEIYEDPPDAGPSPVRLGQHYMQNHPDLQGIILDEVRISTVARYQASFSPQSVLQADGDTALLWHFDEGEGDAALDEAAGLDLGLLGVEWIAADR